MGYFRLHAIAVSSHSAEKLTLAHERAKAIFSDQAGDSSHSVTPIMISRVNQIASFFVGTDGSKEGWEESDQGDRDRAAFIDLLNSCRYEDGSSPYDWAVVQYGDGDGVSKVDDHSDHEVYRDCEAWR